MSYPKAHGDVLRKWRAQNDMLLIEMANGIGVRTSTLSGWETGRSPWMPDQRRKVAVWISRLPPPSRRSLDDLVRIKRLRQLARMGWKPIIMREKS